MKRLFAAELLLCLCLYAAGAFAEIGFAEVRMDNVNVRKSPGGDMRWQLDAGASVYVYEESMRGDTLWCRVYTNAGGKDTVSGWIRGDMLRFVSEEFTDVLRVEAGYQYVTGVRRGGSVAIIGWDMPHLKCIDKVHAWENVVKTSSQICTVFGLDAEDNVLHAGRFGTYEGQKAYDFYGNTPVLLNEDGSFTPFMRERLAEQYGLAEGLLNGQYIEAHDTQAQLFLLTKEGKVYHGTGGEGYTELFGDGLRTVDIDIHWTNLLALKEDGTVRSRGPHGRGAAAVDGWTNVVKIASGEVFSLALRGDGTVYYAGDDTAFAERVKGWKDVVDLDAGDGFAIALFADGHVEMAGRFESYDR